MIGPTNHKDFLLSIYFHDPNGLRLELTTPLDKDWNCHTKQAYRDVELWVETKNRAQSEGRDVQKAMRDLIREERKRYNACRRVAERPRERSRL